MLHGGPALSYKESLIDSCVPSVPIISTSASYKLVSVVVSIVTVLPIRKFGEVPQVTTTVSLDPTTSGVKPQAVDPMLTLYFVNLEVFELALVILTD